MLTENIEKHFNNTIVALLMLLIYIILYMYYFQIYSPHGISLVNLTFVSHALNFFLSLIAFSFLTFMVIIYFIKDRPLTYLAKNKSLFYIRKIDRLRYTDLILLLLPMTPIMQYIILNKEILSLINVISVISFFIFLLIIFVYIVPWLLSIFASRDILMIAALSFFYIMFNMPALSATFNWSHQGSFIIQIAILLLTFLALLLINFMSKKILLSIILVFFIINTTTSIMNAQVVDEDPYNNKDLAQDIENQAVKSAVEGRKIKNKSDVLLIIYESYSNYETMKNYGLDNSAQLDLLEQNGFHVYHGVYSIGIPSIPALSKIFNVDKKLADRKFLAGGGVVHKILKKKGYKTYGIFLSDYNFRGLSDDKIKYDSSFPPPLSGSGLIISAILGGEFSDKVSLERVDYDSYLKKKHKTIKRESSLPAFIYSHSVAPGHRPHLSQNHDDEDEYIDIYLNNIKIANLEMKKDVDKIVKNNPDAITIIAGDHGPFLTKTGYGFHLNPDTCRDYEIDKYDMQDRYGAFLAIRWPDEDYATKHDIEILQDIFPAVFAYLFDDAALFDETRIQPRTTVSPQNICGVSIEDGIIVGGKDDGKPLFEGIE